MMQRFAFILVLSLSLLQCAAGESNLRAGTANYAASSQRRELSWWGNLFNKLGPGKKHGSSSSGSSGSESGSGSGSSSVSGSGSGSGSDSDSGSDNMEQSSSGSSASASTSGSDTSSSNMEEQSNYLENSDENGNSLVTGQTSGANGWIFFAAALVAGAVGTAFMVNKKRQESSAAQPLSGQKKTRKNKVPAAFVEIARVDYKAPQEVTV